MVKTKLFTMRTDAAFFDELDSLRIGSRTRSATRREIIRELAAKAEANRVRDWHRSHPLGPPLPPRAARAAPDTPPRPLNLDG
jgi:hypothetical protein